MTNTLDTLKGSIGNIEIIGDDNDKHLLIAIDQTDDAKRSVLYVAEFLGGFPGFRITLVSIIQEPDEDFFKNDQERKEWIRNREKEVDLLLEKYRQVLIQSGFPEEKVSVRVCIGNPITLSQMILSIQCAMNCCTVVVGRQNKSKTEEFLFGSVSNQLIHEARNCAVWVVE